MNIPKHRFPFLLAIILLIINISQGYTQNNTRLFNSAEQEGNKLILHCSDGTITLSALSTNAMEASFTINSRIQPPSYSIANKAGDIDIQYSENDKEIHFNTSGIEALVKKNPFQISYFYKKRMLIREETGFFNQDSLIGFNMELSPEEKLMGGGSRVLGMNRRGNRLKLYNRASYGYETHADLMYYSMPVVISSQKYMLIFDNGASGFMDLGATDKDILQFEASGGRMSYFIVANDDWQELATSFTEITGRQPLPPRWAFGNMASRMGYRTQKQVESVVDTYINEEIPLDAIILDLFWFGPELQGYMGNLDWDRDSFPQAEQMLKNNRSKGVKTILITEPFILTASFNYKECNELGLLAKKKDGAPYKYNFYFGETGLLDIFNPKTKDWFWNIYKKHSISGVDGWWGDLGEPEVHPDDIMHVNGSGKDVHNLYGHEWAKTVFEGYEKDFPDKRPLILMRSGFVGSQRYGLIPWSGDVNRSWGGLKPQVEISLQMGMQGLAYMHSDLGGFAGIYKDPELYTRWLQYGVFQPVYRTHAQDGLPSEPIYWDEETKNAARKSIQLRYQLTPYIYTLAWENCMKGLPMMRPLFYIDDDPKLLDEKDSYLWGNAFLVHPIIDKGAKKETIYLPKGSHWFDFYTDKLYAGGKTIKMKTTMDHIPVFVKAGAFIPMVPVFQNMDEYSSDTLIVHYYFDAAVKSSTGIVYEDDGESNNSWKNNQFELLQFSSNYSDEKGLDIGIQHIENDYPGKPEDRCLRFIIHNWPQNRAKISSTDKSYTIKQSYDAAKKLLIIESSDDEQVLSIQ